VALLLYTFAHCPNVDRPFTRYTERSTSWAFFAQHWYRNTCCLMLLKVDLITSQLKRTSANFITSALFDIPQCEQVSNEWLHAEGRERTFRSISHMAGRDEAGSLSLARSVNAFAKQTSISCSSGRLKINVMVKVSQLAKFRSQRPGDPWTGCTIVRGFGVCILDRDISKLFEMLSCLLPSVRRIRCLRSAGIFRGSR
jgi:hypothetical protein